jgi:hypothetical protein
MRSLRVVLVVAVTLVTSVFVIAGSASAHDATVSGTVGCTTSGAFQITWTITNDFQTPMSAAVSSTAGGLSASSVNVPATTPPALTSGTVTQILPVSLAGQTVTLDVTATWPAPDPFVQELSADVSLNPACPQPTVEVEGISVAQAVTAAIQFTG